MINASAPGKLFVIGEYAVLEGAPAILSAVNRRVHVTAQHALDDHWRVHAPDINIDDFALGTDGGVPDDAPAPVHQALRVYDAVVKQLGRHGIASETPLHIDIDSSRFSRRGHKLGLGSSAAVAASLATVISRAAGRQPDSATLCKHAIAAHRHAQQGRGSGADVATSVHGGVIEYRNDTVEAALDWPAGITGMAVVTGGGASTTGLVQCVRNYGARDPAGYAADMQRLATLASDARHVMANDRGFLQLVRDYFAALAQLGTHADAGIVLPRHHQLAALAAECGGAFKTTGAGGGDLGLAFARSGAPAQQLATALRNADAHIVPLQFGAHGLQCRNNA